MKPTISEENVVTESFKWKQVSGKLLKKPNCVKKLSSAKRISFDEQSLTTSQQLFDDKSLIPITELYSFKVYTFWLIKMIKMP